MKKTKLIYYTQPYLKELTTTISSVNQTPDAKWHIQLAETIFYPEGGGQPGDFGVIEGTHGIATLLHEKIMDDNLVHVCSLTGQIKAGERINAKLDWKWRYKYMKIHSAGHLLHDVLMSVTQALTPIKGGHGKKAFIEYQGEMDPQLKDKLETEINHQITNDLIIVTAESTAEELASKCPFIPPNLPKNKPLRYIQIGDYPPMPDGGVQVKSTKEIGEIRITSIQSGNQKTKITYQVISSDKL